MDQIKLFYECVDSDEDELKTLQKSCNKWLEKHSDTISVKSITTTLGDSDMDVIITVHYSTKAFTL